MSDHGHIGREMTMAEALRDAMRLAMAEDPNVILLGEDIGVKGGFGGGFTVTLGLVKRFVMPISARTVAFSPSGPVTWRVPLSSLGNSFRWPGIYRRIFSVTSV